MRGVFFCDCSDDIDNGFAGVCDACGSTALDRVDGQILHW